MSGQLMSFLVADLFCGAGGSSEGARRALAARGLFMDLVAVNHWPVAVDTHQRNHPDSRHLCVDVYKTSPREAVPGGRLDLLMASPTCTFNSRARGGKPISRDQRFGRMTPVQVERWLKDLDVRCLLVENVPEFREWGPVDRATGKPIRSKRGVYFRAWIRRLERLGYVVEHRVLNAADYGDATTRQRFFLMGRKDGKPIAWPAPTHSKTGGAGLKRWRAAREIIDWKLKGRSIFNRAKRLSQKTLERIYAGAVRFGWPRPFLEVLRAYIDGAPIPTFTREELEAQGVPLVVRTDMHQSNALCVRSPEDPLATVTTSGGIGLAQPFVLGQRSDAPARSADLPAPTVVTVARIGMVEAAILPQGQGGALRAVSEPVATIPTKGAHALITPYYGASGCASPDQPLGTVTTRDRFGIVMPVTHDDDSQRARPVEDPLPTITGAARGELAFIVPAFGERPTQTPRTHDLDGPAPTLCATGRINLVEAVGFDILFRMLTPRELARAMSFDDEDAAYEFAGNKTEITKQIGNAVPVRTSSALVAALLGLAAAEAA